MSNSRRVLLCIGCDAYQNLSSLNGAQEDAKNVYELLSSPDHGDYPVTSSRLLLSPTCSDVDQTLSELLPANEQIDTLTVFFAGHGGVARGSYYLCMSDTAPGKFATSAYSLSHLFEIINETGPAQCNIIIDACESGGLVSNLSTLLKPELLGMANTSGISIFATSAAKEYSLDTPDGGIGTLQLLRVLKGEVIVQDSRPYLDLVEVGRAAADLIAEEADKLTESMLPGTYTTQTPVVWGLNLFGQSRFSKNPAYDTEQPVSLHALVAIPSRSVAGAAITEASQKIWSLFYDSADDLPPKKIFATLYPVAQKLGNEEDVVKFLSGIAVPLAEKLLNAQDSFALVQLHGTFIALLLQWCGQTGLAESQINWFAEVLIEEIFKQLSNLNNELKDFDNALAFDGLADFYYLPIRISKIVGWAGAALLIVENLGLENEQLCQTVKELSLKILEVYEACIFIISDVQAPYTLAFFMAASKFGFGDVAESFLSLYISQLFSDKANVARASLAPELAYDFVKARAKGELTCTSSMVAHPSEVLAVLLLMARQYKIEDTVDPFLSELDHSSLVIFIPNNHLEFSQDLINQGTNHNFQIGHGVWTIEDLVARWESACLPQLASDMGLNNSSVVIGALCASLLFPDRTPWFLLRSPIGK